MKIFTQEHVSGLIKQVIIILLVLILLPVDKHGTGPTLNRACKLFNIRLYATLCFNYLR